MSRFALTIFLSAFLLFQVQPLISKRILPWFGGSPAVWTTCMLFFQVLLLGGYVYAHLASTRLGQRRQVLTHIAVLGVALAAIAVGFLPLFYGGAGWKPADPAHPTWRIVLLLAAAVGLPYFALSSTSPLLQKWFLLARPTGAVYRLYALSNAGSLLALLSFPVLMEPCFSTRGQALGWAVAFALFAVVSAWCGLSTWGGVSAGAAPAASAEPEERVAPARWLLWLLLPACASMMLLSVTNQMCQDMAVVPFLWVLPLALYLLSFIVCFDSERWYYRPVFWPLMAITITGMTYVLTRGAYAGIVQQIGGYSLGLFACAMVCHGELVRMRPGPRHLTAFYLMVAAGGAAGGVFVSLIAPHLFKTYVELNLAIWLSAAVGLTALWLNTPLKAPGLRAFRVLRLAGFGLAAIGLIALTAILGNEAVHGKKGYVSVSRNFYGVLRVVEHNVGDPARHYYLLMHGRINHGLQYTGEERRRMAVSYYGADTGLGLALAHYPRRSGIRVATVGLGTATVAAYGREGDVFRFYEINPAVLALATRQFTYLGDSRATCEVVMGDARLSMEREPPQQYDVIVLDAFSGDAIPVHLLTREAFEVYRRHLRQGGILCVHISNRHLDLEPVVAGLAGHFGFSMVRTLSKADDANNLIGSRWVLLTNNAEFLALPEIVAAEEAPDGTKPPRKPVLWTDDFSDVFTIMKWK